MKGKRGVFVITSLIFNILGWLAYFRIAACTGSFILSMVFIQFIDACMFEVFKVSATL